MLDTFYEQPRIIIRDFRTFKGSNLDVKLP